MKIIRNRFQVNFSDKDSFVGQGGMGTVYRGSDRLTHEAIAVKLLKPELIQHDPDLVKRFDREGQTLGQLNHPNIVKLLGTAEEDGAHYIIMEYVSGGSLRDVLDETPKFSIQRTLYIALDLADALTRAHRLNVLHRDIKPGNVLMAVDGTPRLTDFGMARVRGESAITQDGAIVGTLAYLAPESFQGEEPDERTDIWAFGALLFEMLTGQRPFPQEIPGALLNAILTQPVPDLETLRPDAPTALIDLIYRMLSKERNARIPSVRLIGAELESIIRGTTTTLQPVVSVADSTGRFNLTTTEFPPLQSSTFVASNNLPNQPTPFIGRESELREINAMLKADTRLLTLVGPGGIGKSRMSVAVATAQLSAFSDGVYYVPLAAIDNPQNVVVAIADQLKLNFSGTDPKVDLLNYLAEKHLLLILDNFEHLIASADLVGDMIAAAPRLSIIVTSRERLRLRGEQVYEISGMHLPTAADENPERLALLPAAILFAQSARRVMPDFQIDATTAAPTAEIIRLVGGLPLGVELAAAWLEMLPLEEITSEIEKSLDFLETDLRDVPERHRSLRAVFEYSWNLLAQDEREILMKLAVFRGGFEREAAQKVTGASLRHLTHLVNKSLLLRDPEGRYRIQKMIRQYAEDKFAGQPALKTETYRAHGQYYTAFTSKVNQTINTSKEKIALETLDAELENVRVMLRYALEKQDFILFDIVQDTMIWFFLGRSMLQEGYSLYKEFADAMEKSGLQDASYWRARARQSYIATRLSRYEEAAALATQAVAFFSSDLRSTERLLPLSSLAYVHMMQGDYPTAIAISLEGLENVGAEEDLVMWFVTMGNLGYAYFLKGDLAKAREIYEDANASLQMYDYATSGAAYMKNNLGEILREMGDINRARVLFKEAYELFEGIGRKRGMAFTILNLAGVDFVMGNYASAKEDFERAYEINREIGDSYGVGHSLSNIGNVYAAVGEHDKANEYYTSSLRIRQQLGDKRGIADSYMDLARCATNCGHAEGAHNYIAESIRIRQEIGDRLGEAQALAGRATALALMGHLTESESDLQAAERLIGDDHVLFINLQLQLTRGEIAYHQGDLDASLHAFKDVLVRYFDFHNDGILPMLLWALVGIARVYADQGDDVAALRLVTQVLQYPWSYINWIEKTSTDLLEKLTIRMPDTLVTQTMMQSRDTALKIIVSELLADPA